MAKQFIKIRGASEHNLKSIDLDIPRDELIVFTGVSGSGKSSLAFDTIYAEGQRRYMESLSSYARQFLGRMEKPRVEAIEGLSPAISIDQKSTNHNPRSTVGTVTEIYDYLRLLYARIGIVHCPECGRPIRRQSVDEMVDAIMALPEGSRIILYSPVVRGRKGEHARLIDSIRRSGYVRVRIDGSFYELSEDISLDKNIKHSIEVVVDRLIVRESVRERLTDSAESALSLSSGLLTADILHDDGNIKTLTFSANYACPDCGISVEEVEPRTFSFNNPYGACPECLGLGYKMIIPEELLERAKHRFHGRFYAEERARLEAKAERTLCPLCHGMRLKKSALFVKVGGLNIHELCSLGIRDLRTFLERIELSDFETQVGGEILKEVRSRLDFLVNVGLDYLTLSRPSATLSGGEAQRIRLATQIGSGLVGVTYILDEPSIGLHQRDNLRLIGALKGLRDLGNTVMVVEHDEETMRAADFIVDLGPGAGNDGGRVVATGTAADIARSPHSLTGMYLSGKKSIPVPGERALPRGYITILGASENNLKDIDVALPLGVITAVTGVSGSGKSTLIDEILYKSLARSLNHAGEMPGRHRGIDGIEQLDKVIMIDQSPIGRTPRSNPATYTGVFDLIRELFAQTQDARVRGYAKGRFSFNVRGGRCEACQGDGIVKIEMHFLPDVYVPCEVCQGKRYTRETLEVRYKGRNISQVLDMTVSEALEFFANIPRIERKLRTLFDVGLGYVKLGQPSTELSGGEAQRVKLATELGRRSGARTIYILDEPTTGLSFYDVDRLVAMLMKLRDGGGTVVVIEHNLDVIKVADYVLDLGPEGGEGGGRVIACGTPEEVAATEASYTGQYLAGVLSPRSGP